MSSADERLVRMRFDNAQFERGVEESLNSIDRLNKKLDSTESTTAFSGITKSINNIDLSGIEKAVGNISNKFSILGTIATTALVNIANQAFQTGEALVKSLSIDNIAEGWDKYNQEVQAVQTIMVTLGDTTSIKEVEEQLKRLSWYSDETSYSYTQMTDALSKFISAGMGMDDSVSAVMGLANAAASAGVGIQKAEFIFKNFSQAMGTGFMGLKDWASIENQNMATPQFKQHILDSAVALGKLKTTIGETGETLYYFNKKSNAFTVEGFRNELAEKWFDKEVMMDVLKRYAAFSDQVQNFQKEYGDALGLNTASETIKYLQNTGLAIDDFSTKAFLAGQEAKSFSEAIGSVKDAVSTGWKDTFKLIFGNYEEAKILWTQLAEELYEVFAAGAEARNDLLEKWSKYQGKAKVFEGLWNIFHNLVNAFNAIKEAWNEVFPPMTLGKTLILSRRFRTFTERIMLSDESLKKLKTSMKTVFEFFSYLYDKIKYTINELKRLGPPLKDIISKLNEIFGPIWDKIKNKLKESEAFQNYIIGNDGIDFVVDVLVKALETIYKVLDWFSKQSFDFSSLKTTKDTLISFKSAVVDVLINGLNVLKDTSGSLKEKLEALFSYIASLFKRNTLSDSAEKTVLNLGIMEESYTGFSSILFGVYKFITAILSKIISIFDATNIGDLFRVAFLIPLILLVRKLTTTTSILSETFDSIIGVFTSFSTILKAKAKEWKSKAFLNFALGIVAIIGAIIMVANIADQSNLDYAIGIVIGLFTSLYLISILFGKLDSILNKGPGIEFTGSGLQITGIGRRTGIMSLVLSVFGMVLAIKMLNDILTSNGNSEERIWTILKILGGIVAGLLAFITIVNLTGKRVRLGLSTFYPIVLVLALMALVKVVKQLDSMTIEHPGKVILGMVGLISAILIVSKLASKISTNVRSIVQLSASFLIIVLALKLLNTVAKDFTWKSALITGLVLGLITIFGLIAYFVEKSSKMDMLSNGIKIKGIAGSIISISLSFLAIVLALKIVKSLDVSTVVKGLSIFLILLISLGAVLKLSEFTGKYAARTIISISVLLIAIGGILSILSALMMVNQKSVLYAAGIIAGLLIIISGIMRFGMSIKDASSIIPMRNILAFSTILIALSALTVSIALLSAYDPKKVLLIVGIISALLLVIAVISKFGAGATSVSFGLSTKYILSMVGLILAISVFLSILYALDAESLVVSMTALSVFFASLGILLRQLNRIAIYKGTIGGYAKAVILLITVLGLICASLYGLSKIANNFGDVNQLLVALFGITAALSVLLGIIGVYQNLVRTISWKTFGISILSLLSVITILVLGIAAASHLIDFNNLKNINKDLALGILGFIVVVLAVQALASFIGLIGLGPLAVGLIGMTAVIGYLMLIMKGIAGWNGASDEELENFKNKIIKVGELFIILAKIVGLAIGYVLFGWLPALAEMLTLFAEGMKPFSDAINKLPDDFVDQVGKFGEAMLRLILNLAIAHSLNVGLFGLGNVIAKFAEKLNDALPDLVEFFKQMSTVDGIDKATAAMGALAAIARSINNINPQGEFRLRNFGQDISGFFDYIKKINDKNIESVRYISTMLRLLSSDKIDYSHMDSQMAAAGSNAALFAESMTTFAQHTTNPQLYKTASETAPYLMGLIAQLSTSEQAISSTSGLFLFLSQDIFNNGGMSAFGERLKTFTEGISAYAMMLSRMNATMLIQAVGRTKYITKIVEALASSEKEITPNKGIFAFFEAHPDIGTFITNITNAIPAMKDYITAITTGIPLNDLSNAVGRTELLAQVLNALSTANASFEKDNSGKLKNLAKALTGKDGIAAGIISYCTDITSYEGDIYKVSAITSQISNAIKSLVHADNTADIEAFNSALKRIIANGLDEWLEVFKEWPRQDKLNQAVQEFTDGIVTAFGLADNGQKISESLLTPINNLLKALNAKGINFYNTGHNLTQQLLNGLNSLKLEYQSNLEEIKNIPTSILDTVSSEDVANNSALSFMADQLRDLTGAAQEAKEAVPTALEEVLTTTKELGVNVETGQNGRGLSDWFSGLKNKVGLNIDSNQILDTLGLNYESFDLTNLGTLSGETYSSGFMQSLLSNMSPETLDYTAYVDQFMSEMQASLDQYGIDTGGLTVDVMPVLSDGSTIADFEGIMGDMYGPNIQYNTDAITNLTEKVTVLNTKLDNLTSALNNQTIKHEGTINVKYTNQQGLVDSVTRAIIDNLRVGGRI